MASPYEKQLTARAKQFISDLQSADIDAQVIADSLRDYQISLAVSNSKGVLNIFYSPKRDFYSLTMSQVTGALREQVQAVWDGANADKAKDSILKQAKTPYQAFVDGSYHSQRKTVGYGAIVLKDGKEVQRFSGRVPKYEESHQIAGELSATMRVIAWCRQENIAQVDIFYDYLGIEKWATGAYKTEKPMSQEYAKFMREAGIKVHWHKVASHTGVYWNEIADALAKAGALMA